MDRLREVGRNLGEPDRRAGATSGRTSSWARPRASASSPAASSARAWGRCCSRPASATRPSTSLGGDFGLERLQAGLESSPGEVDRAPTRLEPHLTETRVPAQAERSGVPPPAPAAPAGAGAPPSTTGAVRARNSSRRRFTSRAAPAARSARSRGSSGPRRPERSARSRAPRRRIRARVSSMRPDQQRRDRDLLVGAHALGRPRAPRRSRADGRAVPADHPRGAPRLADGGREGRELVAARSSSCRPPSRAASRGSRRRRARAVSMRSGRTGSWKKNMYQLSSELAPACRGAPCAKTTGCGQFMHDERARSEPGGCSPGATRGRRPSRGRRGSPCRRPR